MPTLEELTKEVEKLKQRNIKVEADKAWEGSLTRTILIALLTYIVIVAFFYFASLPEPFTNAIIPALAYSLSTITAPKVREWWLKKKQ
jgi:hypothetical protein